MNLEDESASEFKVVVGVSYTRTGELAMERGLQSATSEPGVELHLVHALVPPEGESPSNGAVIIDAVSMMQARERLRAYGERSLAAFLARHPGLETPRIVAHIRIGEPAHAILQCAAEVGAMLIVIGTRHPRAFGSVADAVTADPPCTVCVMRCIGAAHEPTPSV